MTNNYKEIPVLKRLSSLSPFTPFNINGFLQSEPQTDIDKLMGAPQTKYGGINTKFGPIDLNTNLNTEDGFKTASLGGNYNIPFRHGNIGIGVSHTFGQYLNSNGINLNGYYLLGKNHNILGSINYLKYPEGRDTIYTVSYNNPKLGISAGGSMDRYLSNYGNQTSWSALFKGNLGKGWTGELLYRTRYNGSKDPIIMTTFKKTF